MNNRTVKCKKLPFYPTVCVGGGEAVEKVAQHPLKMARQLGAKLFLVKILTLKRLATHGLSYDSPEDF